jgi:hypothetical protein
LRVSLALLLAGGMALAQGMYAIADKKCAECQPENGRPEEDYAVHIEYGGWDVRRDWYLCAAYEPPPTFRGSWIGICGPASEPGPLYTQFGPLPLSGLQSLEGLVEDPSCCKVSRTGMESGRS